jgi:heme A synthase
MRELVEILNTMGPEQLFLALVYLGCHTLALGELATSRGRLVAVMIALGASAGFATLSPSWPAAVILLAMASVGIALFAAAAWALWLASASRARAARESYESAANLPRTAAAVVSRSVKTAPILNSPLAD